MVNIMLRATATITIETNNPKAREVLNDILFKALLYKGCVSVRQIENGFEVSLIVKDENKNQTRLKI
jgi:hypothetical protein